MCGLREGNEAGPYRLHTKLLWTQTYLMGPDRSQWLISPRAALHFVTGFKECKQVFSLTKWAYYLRTARKDLLRSVWFFFDRKAHKAKKMTWCQIKNQAKKGWKNVSPVYISSLGITFKYILFSSWCSLTCLLPLPDTERNKQCNDAENTSSSHLSQLSVWLFWH